MLRAASGDSGSLASDDLAGAGLLPPSCEARLAWRTRTGRPRISAGAVREFFSSPAPGSQAKIDDRADRGRGLRSIGRPVAGLRLRPGGCGRPPAVGRPATGGRLPSDRGWRRPARRSGPAEAWPGAEACPGVCGPGECGPGECGRRRLPGGGGLPGGVRPANYGPPADAGLRGLARGPAHDGQCRRRAQLEYDISVSNEMPARRFGIRVRGGRRKPPGLCIIGSSCQRSGCDQLKKHDADVI